MVFNDKYFDFIDAINDLNLQLVNWNASGKSQRFGQYLESQWCEV